MKSPVNSLPFESKRSIIIDEGKTHFDSMAHICRHEKAGSAPDDIGGKLIIN